MKLDLFDDIKKPEDDDEPTFGTSGKICSRCGVYCEWKRIPNKGWKLYNGFKPHVCGVVKSRTD